jgi:hypothetical protein
MRKIKLKLKKEQKQQKIDLCPICSQNMDICVTSHKNKPFVDNKFYSKMCFTCFCAPKILDQKYDEKGYISEEKELDYCKKNLHSAQELFDQGSADSLAYAKKSVKSIKKLVSAKEIKNKIKPKLEFYLNK